MTENRTGEEHGLTKERNHAADVPQISLTALFSHGVVEVDGQPRGRVDDVIVNVRSPDYPEVTGLVVKVGKDRTFVLADSIIDVSTDAIRLKSDRWGFQPVALGDDEVSLKADILCERVVDIARSRLVRVYDVRLSRRGAGWAAVALDVHRARWLGFGAHAAHQARDWRNFLPLARLSGVPVAQTSPNWIGRLKPAQIADLIEGATVDEQDKLLEQVHSDPELEADVFQELEEDSQAQVFKSLSDAEIADLMSRMRADDAADAVMELAQDRRQPVLALLAEGQRAKVMTLLGYNEATAGGLMGTDFIALPASTTVQKALQRIREATSHQPEALITIHSLATDGQLTGVLGLVQALQADPKSTLEEAADHDVVAASPEDEISKVVARMADFNLMSLPVVDENGRLLGVVTVDDALEAALPSHWVNR